MSIHTFQDHRTWTRKRKVSHSALFLQTSSSNTTCWHYCWYLHTVFTTQHCTVILLFVFCIVLYCNARIKIIIIKSDRFANFRALKNKKFQTPDHAVFSPVCSACSSSGSRWQPQSPSVAVSSVVPSCPCSGGRNSELSSPLRTDVAAPRLALSNRN